MITYGAGEKLAMAQRTAGKVEMKGYFDAGPVVSERVSSAFDITVDNVADGSGTATIDNNNVGAGSTDNDFSIRFSAQGSMDGGQVVLISPQGWGKFQGTDPAAANYIDIDASSGATLRDTGVGNDRAIAHLETFGYGHVLTFTIRDLEAQPGLGIAKFVIQSAGSRGGELMPVKGEEAKAEDVDTEIEKVAEKMIVLAAAPGEADGALRVQVTGGGDGSGKATVTIVGSKEGPGIYDVVNDDGETEEVTTELVHAGDDSTYLVFTYTPIETISIGKLEFSTPTSWSYPQADSTRDPGFTRLIANSGSIGSPTFNGATMTVGIHSLDKNGSIVIHYGEGDGGAVVPKTRQTRSAFHFKAQGSDDTGSSLQSLAAANQPSVEVLPQASGRGDVSIDTGGDVHAGATGREVTITYTSIGQVVGAES